MKKKLVFLITKSNFGGAQRYVFNLANSFHNKDGKSDADGGTEYHVSVISGARGPLNDKLDLAGIANTSIDDLDRDIDIFKEFRVFFELLKIFRRDRPDIIHLNSSKIGGIGAVAGRLSGIKRIIFTGHGWAFNEDRPLWQRIFITFLHWLMVMLCHQTIAVSEKTRKDMAYLPFIKNKIKTIYIGSEKFDLIEKDPARTFLTEKFHLDKNTTSHSTWIGTLSELHKNKGLDFAIKALAEINDETNKDRKEHLDHSFIFLIFGQGQEKVSLEKLIEERGLKDKVFLLGYVEDARRYLKALDIFTLTSRTEAFPFAVTEAGKASLPVIASSVGGIPEIIKQFENGILVKPGHIKEIRESLKYLMQNTERANAMGRRLNSYIKEKFGTEEMLSKTETLYQE